MKVKALAEKHEQDIIGQRRWFHEYPELSWEERSTTDAIAAQLSAMGLEVRRFDGLTGCTATIRGGKAKDGCRTVALRADIDALPVEEKTGLPFASKNPGVMHACGHDCHMAMLLGAARILVELRDELKGSVKLFFQGAEETSCGAVHYIEQGVLEGVDAIFGMHVWDGLEASCLNVQPGIRMASCDNFSITVEGVSCHASNPSGGIDAIVAAAAVIMNLQSIVSRSSDPRTAVTVSIGEIHGGQRFNIIANKVVMEGTCRTHSREMREKLEPLLRRVVEETAAAYGAKATLRYAAYAGPLINDQEELNRIALAAALKLYGNESVKEMPPLMGSEDFAYYMESTPGFYAYLGSHDERHCVNNHNDHYDVDEAILKRGAALYAQFALDYLRADNG